MADAGEIEVRAAVPSDRDEVLRVAVDSGLFSPEDVGAFADVVDAGLVADAGPAVWLVAEASAQVVAAAYAAPEPFGDRVWNLLFLAVERSAQSRGAGTALVAALDERLRAAGPGDARILLVETSSGPDQDVARAFYAARGFTEEARIREYYGPDEDKVVFWRRLST